MATAFDPTMATDFLSGDTSTAQKKSDASPRSYVLNPLASKVVSILPSAVSTASIASELSAVPLPPPTIKRRLSGSAMSELALSLKPATSTLATPFGDQWLDPTVQVIVDVGRLAQGRQHRWSLPHPPITPGLTITMQAVTLSRDYEFSMATLIAFP